MHELLIRLQSKPESIFISMNTVKSRLISLDHRAKWGVVRGGGKEGAR